MLIEHLPELVRALGLIRLVCFFGHRQFRAEKEVPDRVLVQHPMNQDPLGMALEVDAMIARAEAVEGTTIPLDLAELAAGKGVEIFGKNLELREKIELEILGEGAHFGSADRVEDDLEHDQ